MTINELSKALKILNEAAAQRADFSKYQYEPVEQKPKVYPNALGKPILSKMSKNAQKACSKIAQIFPNKELFWLGKNPELEKLGLEAGEVYVRGDTIRKLVSDKQRFQTYEIIDTLRSIITNPELGAVLELQKNGGKVLKNAPKVISCKSMIYNKLYKIIIAQTGKLKNCIVTCFSLPKSKNPRDAR